MPVKLHRCKNTWAKFGGHPCWRVQKALDEAGIEYELVKWPWPGGKREKFVELTGQRSYPAIELEDGTFYHEESKAMVARIAAGELPEPREAPE